MYQKKKKVVLLTTKQKIGHVKFDVEITTIHLTRLVIYLGLSIDKTFKFAIHVAKILRKGDNTITELSRIMPNCIAPRAFEQCIKTKKTDNKVS